MIVIGAHHGLLRRDRRPRAERHQARHRLFDLLAARLHVRRPRRRRLWRPACSTSSRTPSSRRCCSSAPARSSTRCTTSRTCATWAGLRRYIPFTTAMMAIGTLALTGFPLTAGYFPRTRSSRRPTPRIRPAAAFAFLAHGRSRPFMTSFYSWRLFFMTFEGARALGPRHGHEATIRTREPITRASSTTSTATTSSPRSHARRTSTAHHGDHTPAREPADDADPARRAGARRARRRLGLRTSAFIGHGYEEFWKGALFTAPDNHILEEMHHVPGLGAAARRRVMMVARLRCSPGVSTSATRACRRSSRPSHPLLYRFLLNKWYFDELYDVIFVRPAMRLGRFLWKHGRRPDHRRPRA